MTLHDTHPDEGTIHTWLDGELDAAAALDLEVHVAGCAECRARVAEARGLIAGASRIVRTLDDPSFADAPRTWGDPIPTITSPAAMPAPSRTTAWRFLRLTPGRAAIAATLLVAVGISLTRVRTIPESIPTVAMNSESKAAAGAPSLDTSSGPAQSTAPAIVPRRAAAGAPATARANAPAPAPTVAPLASAPSRAAPIRDQLLDSAIARNVAQAQPPRAVGAAAGGGIPQPTPTSPSVADSTGRTRVAVARSALRVQSETASGAADRTRVGAASAADAAPLERTIAAAKAAENTATAPRAASRVPVRADVAAPSVAGASANRSAVSGAATGSGECYRIESATGEMGAWGSVPLPFVIALDVGSTTARVIGPSGAETDSRAVWMRGAADSLLLTLRHSGFVGSLSLGAPGEVRAGIMRSHPTAAALERRSEAAPQPQSEPARQPRNAGARRTTDAIEAAPAVPVVARRSACPTR